MGDFGRLRKLPQNIGLLKIMLVLVIKIWNNYASTERDVPVNLALGTKVNSDEFAESGRIVVFNRLGVSKSLKHRIASDKLLV